jgi:hypothetical protein
MKSARGAIYELLNGRRIRGGIANHQNADVTAEAASAELPFGAALLTILDFRRPRFGREKIARSPSQTIFPDRPCPSWVKSAGRDRFARCLLIP